MNDWEECAPGGMWYNPRLECFIWRYDPKDDPFEKENGPVLWVLRGHERTITIESIEQAMRDAEELYGHRN